MFTTAGSTRFTMEANEAPEGIGSGTASGVALVPANEKVFIAETRPETTEPMRMPTVSVSATNAEAKILRRRAQSNNSFTCCPMFVLLFPPIVFPARPTVYHRDSRSNGLTLRMRYEHHWPEGRVSAAPFWISPAGETLLPHTI